MAQKRNDYEPKQKVFALLNGTYHAAVVVEVGQDATTAEKLYYVRYLEQDGRMDRWLPATELKPRQHGRTQQHANDLSNSTSGGITTRRQSVVAAERAAEDAARGPRTSSRDQFSKGGGSHTHGSVTASFTQRARKDSAFFSRARNVHAICMGPYGVEAWYYSPYHLARPAVHQRMAACSSDPAALLVDGAGAGSGSALAAGTPPVVIPALTLHICPYCLAPYLDHPAVVQHVSTSCRRHPPGNEIYRDPVRQLVVLEVDGKLEPVFCEHLALLSKLFLEHKALDNDMSPFLFYVLCSIQPHGMEVLAYFSKEKQTPERYNLSCILVLPQFQSRGIGRFLIELSYELTKREGATGTPEKPLSDLGEKLYMSYWADTVLLSVARGAEEGHCVTIDYIMRETGMLEVDVTRTLQHLRMLNGTELTVSDEDVQRCFAKRFNRERNVQNYTFYPHLLSWLPAMYTSHADISSV